MTSFKIIVRLIAQIVPKSTRRLDSRNLSFSRVLNSPPITIASVDAINDTVKVRFSNEVERDYPWLFLQDNCTCENCFHSSSQSRKRLMTHLDLHKRLTSVELFGADAIKCTWSDGHEGIFTETWLQERCFSEENIRLRKTSSRNDVTFTRSNFNIQRCDFTEMLKNPAKLLSVLQVLCKYGVFLVENAPRRTGQLRTLIEKIGFIRTTHYGNEFTVKSERNASNLAYTSTPLCVHTDLPYYVYPPGIQLLHCIQQYKDNDGGNSHLVDGFLVAYQMKKLYPGSYDILSDVPVEFMDVGEDYTKFHKIHHSPTHSKNDRLIRIVYSNQQLSSVLPVSVKKVKPLYEALKLFTTLCYDETNLMKFKLAEGDILVFDNWRMLHGREGFNPSKGDRHLEGCYIDWDEVDSTIRVLRNSSKS